MLKQSGDNNSGTKQSRPMPRIIAGDSTTQAAAVAAAAVQTSNCEWGLAAEGNVAEQSTLVGRLDVEGASMKGEAVADVTVAGDAGDEKAGVQASGSRVADSCIPDCVIDQA